MLTCDTCRERLLDDLYGLLEPAETEALVAHLAACPACAAVKDQLERQRDLLAQAAKQSFPEASFSPPPVPAEPVPLAPADAEPQRPRRTIVATWTRWVVAASLLLAVAALGAPTARDLGGFLLFKPQVSRDLAAFDAAKAEKERLDREIQRRKDEVERERQLAQKKVEDREQKLQTTVASWVKAEEEAQLAARTRPFNVVVSGPTVAIPGAPNDYAVNVTDRNGAPKKVSIVSQVKDPAGKVVFEKGFDANAADKSVHLPADLWKTVATGNDLTLHITAIDPDGAKAEVREAVRLQEPLYTTLLVTDKPMYRPGESVYFRSLTLDRTSLQPPAREMNLRFELKAPSGQPVPGLELVGLAKPAKTAAVQFGGPNAGPKPILGPDGMPVRGVGTGEFKLPEGLVGGEYTLTAHEVPVNGTHPQPGVRPLTVRKFIVNNYTPDLLEKKLEFDAKTYGPGDAVQAKIEVRDQAKPLANAKLSYAIEADGVAITPSVAPATTDAQGNASIRFTLPKAEEIKEARLTVTVRTDAIVEPLVRRVPLASRKLTVEFFPEGGNLIAGTENRVYIRATTTTGKPADIQGVLTDGTKDICTLRTLTDADHPGANQGLGVFAFTPEAGKKYAVKLDKPVGIIQPIAWTHDAAPAILGASAKVEQRGYRLPEAGTSGVVLRVMNEVTKPGEKLQLRLASTAKRSVVIGAYIRGRAVAHQTATLDANKPTDLAMDLGGTKLGGVTRVTVFEQQDGGEQARAQLTPVAERLVYRQPGESLKLGFTAKKPGSDAAAKSFIPGDRVQLDITAKTELDQPTTAILMAAVVNQSVITMADEKTARLLPTHFLLAGEIQHPDDLEHADFLLTEHPLAHTAIDLLLGTQGWRRFAEQAPAEFRRKFQNGEADHLLVASAGPGLPVGLRADARKVFDEFWPRYEATLLDLESAEKDLPTKRYTAGELEVNRQTAQIQEANTLSALGRSAYDLKYFDDSMSSRRTWLPLTLLFVFGVSLGLALLRLSAKPGTVPTRPVTTGAVGFAVLGLFVLAAALVTGFDNSRWRSVASTTTNWTDHHGQRYGYGGKMAAPPQPTSAIEPGADPQGIPLDDLGMELEGVDKADQQKAINERRFLAPGMPAAPPPVAALPLGGAVPQDFAPPQAERFAEAAKPGAAGMPAPKFAPRGKGIGGGLGAAMGKDKDMAGDFEMQFEKGEAKQLAQKGDFDARGGRGFDGRFRANANGRAQLRQRGLNDRLGVELQEALKKQDEQADRFGGVEDSKKRKAMEWSVRQQIESSIPFTPPLVVREYAHVRPEKTMGKEGTRTDFTETLLWQPVLVTPADGKATVSFGLSDAVNGYQVLVSGHTLDGRIGATTGTIEVRKPFAIDPKLPQEISSTDKLEVPVVLTNGTDTTRSADVKLSLSGLKADVDGFTHEMTANGGGRKFLRLTPSKLDGALSVRLDATATGNLKDSIERTFKVVPDGFPAEGSRSEMLEQVARVPVRLPDSWLPGTLKTTVTVYPSTLSELQAGLDGLLREPSGCFEQTSTTNYPNVLIMGYLNETNQAKPEVAKRARELMDRGYARLTGYECPKTGADVRKGFEWFGATDRPHESLTAYGILQFTDMSAVYPVDATMLKRTKEFLINSRDGQGGFKRNSTHLDTFGGAPAHLTNAYIVWAITEAERTSKEAPADLAKEIDTLFKQATDKDHAGAKDPYFLALVGNTLLNRGRTNDGITLLKTIAGLQAKDGSVPGATTSITSSSGRDLLIETTAFTVLGWLKANRVDLFLKPTQDAMKWIGQQRDGGGSFGSTQATIMSLKALIEYARANKKPAESGELRVFLGTKEIAKKSFTTESSGPIVLEIPDVETTLKPGETELRIESTTKQAYPLSVAWTCRTTKPNSSPDCAVKLDTKLARTDVAEGESVRLDVKVENLKTTPHGMVVAIVGLPAGLKLPEDMKQLKELTATPKDGSEPTISYWETRGRELVLYWRGMTPKQSVSFGLDLIADVPGEYRGPASRAYLYYNADHKQWVEPVGVKVRAK